MGSTILRTSRSGPPLAVRATGLRMEYANGHRALNGIELEVPPGQVVSLVGPNGSGKSTLLWCLVRLRELSAGTIDINGRCITAARGRNLRSIRTGVGFIFQSFNLSATRSVFANVLSGAASTQGLRNLTPSLAPASLRQDAMVALARLGMDDYSRKRVDELSVGQQQRVAIARMLMQKPRLILADEPVSSLDPRASVTAMALLLEIAREAGTTMIAAMHDLRLAQRFTDRMVCLKDGTVWLDAPIGSLPAGQLRDLYGDAPELGSDEKP